MFKKTIIIFTILLLFWGISVHADTSSLTSDNNEKVISLLKQLILLLMQQIETLQKQISLQQLTTPNITTTTLLNQSQNQLRIVSDYSEAKTHSALLEWYTNQLTESKVYLSGGNFQSRILPSEAGFANHHVVHIYGLEPATVYFYKIVAIKNEEVVLKTGEFKTYPSTVPSFKVKIIGGDYVLFNDDNSFHHYYMIQIVSPEGTPYTNIKVKIDDKEYITDNQGIILYRGDLKCGTKLMLFILTDTIENIWTSYELPIEQNCIKPTTEIPESKCRNRGVGVACP